MYKASLLAFLLTLSSCCIYLPFIDYFRMGDFEAKSYQTQLVTQSSLNAKIEGFALVPNKCRSRKYRKLSTHLKLYLNDEKLKLDLLNSQVYFMCNSEKSTGEIAFEYPDTYGNPKITDQQKFISISSKFKFTQLNKECIKNHELKVHFIIIKNAQKKALNFTLKLEE